MRFIFSLFSMGPDSCFWEFHHSLVTLAGLGIFVFFLIFCESFTLIFLYIIGAFSYFYIYLCIVDNIIAI